MNDKVSRREDSDLDAPPRGNLAAYDRPAFRDEDEVEDEEDFGEGEEDFAEDEDGVLADAVAGVSLVVISAAEEAGPGGPDGVNEELGERSEC